MTCKCNFVILFLCLLSSFFKGFSQQNQYNYSKPLDIPLSISGSFGELRTNSFHMGIDFKTMGTIGHNVHAIDDGYLIRIKVEPGGYGQALYINHPNGYTSVYGHLESFSPEIEQYCKEEQYAKKSFAVDIILPPGKIPIKKGQIIALSGNRGGSSGPHLHFEIRDTKSEAPISVFKYTNISIEDNLSPAIDRVWIYPVNENSLVNGKHSVFNFVPPFKTTKSNKLFASGEIGIGIQSYDRTNGSINKTGVYSTEMYVNDSLIFDQVMDKISYTEVRYVNSLMDYSTFIRTGARINRLFLQPNNKLGVYKHIQNHGFISFNDSTTKRIRIVLRDEYGNQKDYSFSIKGKRPSGLLKAAKPAKVAEIMSWKKINTFENKDIKLVIPKDALYDDLPFEYEKFPRLPGYYSFSYQIHNIYTPLHKPCTLSIKPVDLPENLQSKALIVGVNTAGNVNWAGGEFQDGYVVANIRTFGRYMIGIDTVPPTIKPAFHVRNNDFSKWGQIAFYIQDDFSGIGSYEGLMDGNWVLFEYDLKSNMISHKFDPEKIVFGKSHTLDLFVYDAKGNKTEYHTQFFK